MKQLRSVLVALVVCGVAGASALGCNTFRGAGKDIQRGGQAIENAADNAQSSNQTSEEAPPAILARAAHGGLITPGGSTQAIYGSTRTFSVTPQTGYHVADVLVDGKSVGAVSRHTFENITEEHTISAVFTPDPVR